MSYDSSINFYGELFNKPNVTPEIRGALQVARSYGLALIKARTPVDTGALKEHWKAKTEGQGIRWSNQQHYAGFVELGTRKMAPRQMLAQSIPDIERVFEEELRRSLGRKFGVDIIAQVYQPTYENTKDNQKRKTIEGRRVVKGKPLINKSRAQEIAKAHPLLRRGGITW